MKENIKMKNYITKLLLIGFLALPQVASAFPALNKPSEVAPLVHALYHDKDTVTIAGTKYKIEFESAAVGSLVHILVIDMLDKGTSVLNIDEMGPIKLRKTILLVNKIYQGTYSKKDLWELARQANHGLSKYDFDLNYASIKEVVDLQFSKLKPSKQAKDLMALKSFVGYKKVGNGKVKQRYSSSDTEDKSADFFLVAPKAKDVVTKAGSSKKKDDKKAKKAKKKSKKAKK